MNNMYQMQPGMMGQYYNPYGVPMGTQYVQTPKAKNTQPLAADVINKLKQTGDEVNYTVSQEDIWRAQCTHKDKNGLSTLSQNPDGSVHCNICGKDFNFFDGSVKDVEETTKKMEDILQTIKTIFLDVPENFAAAYFQFLPLMDKIPQLWDRSVKCFSRYGDQQVIATPTGFSTNNWGILGQMTGNPMYAGMYGAPMYQQPMQPMQPVQMPVQQMPQHGYMNMTPMMATPGQQQMVANPFVAGGAPMPAPQAVPTVPSIPAPQQMMGQPTQPIVSQASVAPQAPQPVTESPAGNGEVVQQQTFKV